MVGLPVGERNEQQYAQLQPFALILGCAKEWTLWSTANCIEKMQHTGTDPSRLLLLKYVLILYVTPPAEVPWQLHFEEVLMQVLLGFQVLRIETVGPVCGKLKTRKVSRFPMTLNRLLCSAAPPSWQEKGAGCTLASFSALMICRRLPSATR